MRRHVTLRARGGLQVGALCCQERNNVSVAILRSYCEHLATLPHLCIYLCASCN